MTYGRPAVDNLGVINKGIDLWVKRAQEWVSKDYQDFVWRVFLRIVRETPQYTGKAVANWNIGLNAPNTKVYVEAGDEPIIQVHRGLPMNMDMGVTIKLPRHEKGDDKWQRVARERNRPLRDKITRGTVVYFSNGVFGDTDGGTASPYYLEALQDQTYWAAKLRAVNKPYETAQESLMFELANKGRLPGGRWSRIGGENLLEF